MNPYNNIPPSDREAEKCALAAIMLDAAVRRAVLSMIGASAFFQPEHAIIFTAIKRLDEADTKIDSVSVRAELISRGTFEEIGGTAYLGEILNSVPSAGHGVMYAEIVRKHARSRWLLKLGLDTATAASDPSIDAIEQALQVRDHLSAGIRKARLAVTRDGGYDELAKLHVDTESGAIRAIPMHMLMASRLTKALRPDTWTMLCGTAGFGKTIWILQLLLHLNAIGVSAACFMLEGQRAWHLSRVLAILAGDSLLLDDDAIRDNPGWAQAAAAGFADTIEAIGRSIFDASNGDCTLEALGHWVEQEAENHRVLIVDPISLAEAGRDRWLADERFQKIARDAISKHGASLVCVTHPRTGAAKRGPLTLDDLAGGSVFVRAAETVLCLNKFSNPKTVTLKDRFGVELNRTADGSLKILKSRNGVGAGGELAMKFSPAELRFEELGLLMPEAEEVPA